MERCQKWFHFAAAVRDLPLQCRVPELMEYERELYPRLVHLHMSEWTTYPLCFEPVPGGRTPKEACSGMRAFIEAYSSEDQLDMWDEAVEELYPHLCAEHPGQQCSVCLRGAWTGRCGATGCPR